MLLLITSGLRTTPDDLIRSRNLFCRFSLSPLHMSLQGMSAESEHSAMFISSRAAAWFISSQKGERSLLPEGDLQTPLRREEEFRWPGGARAGTGYFGPSQTGVTRKERGAHA